MTIRHSDKQIAILLGATLMYWGVPFHIVTKRMLSEDDQFLLDTLSDRLIALRGGDTLRQVDPWPVEVSLRELSLLIEVLDMCLRECRGNAITIRLHLNAESEEEVRALLNQLRKAQLDGP